LVFGVIGFIDDYLKISKKSANGLNAKQKYLAQSFSAIAISLWIVSNTEQAISTDLLIQYYE
jgi:phospho-N-acetylmuramoyl-pentapeptide-transferase